MAEAFCQHGLAPGQGKTIRIRATLPESPTAAEYRTHLTVTSLPPRNTGLTAEEAASSQRGEFVFRVQSIFGVSIPLIVRSGNAEATALFGRITMLDGVEKPTLVVPIRREGSTSLYANLEVRTGSGRNGELVGIVRGLGIYPEVSERVVRLPLSRKLRKGELLKIRYVPDEGGSALAEAAFTAP